MSNDLEQRIVQGLRYFTLASYAILTIKMWIRLIQVIL